MEDEFFTGKPVYSKKRKFWFELRDILAGVAFPLMLSVILSASIIAFASADDLAISLVALIGGEAMFVGSLIIFGRANGSAAYKKTVLQTQKRALNSSDERAVYGTGEYAVWKGIVIPLIVCLPFIILQSIHLIAPNNFCAFCLKYVCAWAYYPFSYLGEKYQALNYILILLPVGVHMLGYYLGKRSAKKTQDKLAEISEDGEPKVKRRKK